MKGIPKHSTETIKKVANDNFKVYYAFALITFLFLFLSEFYNKVYLSVAIMTMFLSLTSIIRYGQQKIILELRSVIKNKETQNVTHRYD